MDAETYPMPYMEDHREKMDTPAMEDAMPADVHNAYFKPIARFLLGNMGFKDRLQVTASFVLISDDSEESKFNFDDIIDRCNEANYSRVDKSVQTDLETAAVASHVDSVEVASQTDPTKDNDSSGVAVKVEKYSDLEDEESNLYGSDAVNFDHTIMKVIPSSPDNNPALKVLPGIQCPLCPLRFNETLAAEKHLKRIHDIGNIYHCKYCSSMLQSKTALNEHMAECLVHEPEKEAKSKRGRKGKAAGSKVKIEAKTVKKEKKILIVKTGEPKRSRGRPRKTPEAAPKVTKPKPCETESASEAKEDDDMADLLDLLDDDVIPETEENKSDSGAAKKNPIYDPDYVPHGENKREVKCSSCENKYQSKRALRRHFETVHNLKRNICEVCGKLLMGKESLYHHMRGVHGNKKCYKCDRPNCNATFNFSHSLKMHKLKHSGLRPHMCTTCGKTYLTSHHLKIHIQATHSENKSFTCNICGKAFSYSTSLKMHERSHAKLRPNPCTKCSKAFVNAQALKYHIMAKHTVSGNFKCDVCGKLYKTEFLLKTHKRRHTPMSTRFMCDVCGNRYMYKSGLELHRSVHKDEKSYCCNTCDKKFKTYPALYSHQYVHKTDEPHQCTQCGKSFKTKERMKAHEKRHTGLKPFECTICFHCFPDNGGLSKHMKTVHCTVKRFSCDICGKTTSRADNLRVHMKVHYKGDIHDLDQKQLKIVSGTSKVAKTMKNNLPSRQHTPVLKTDDNMKKQSNDSFNAEASNSNHKSTEEQQSDLQVNMNQNAGYSRHTSGLYLPHLQQFNRHDEPDDFDRSPENLSMNQSTNMPPQHLTTMPHLTGMSNEAHSSPNLHGLPSAAVPTSSMVGSQPNTGPLSSLHVPSYMQYVYQGGHGANLSGFYQ